jgi:hypothetical protein
MREDPRAVRELVAGSVAFSISDTLGAQDDGYPAGHAGSPPRISAAARASSPSTRTRERMMGTAPSATPSAGRDSILDPVAALKRIRRRLMVAGVLYLLVAPLDGAFALTVILVLWFVAVGIARIVMSVTDRATPVASLPAISGIVMSTSHGVLRVPGA